MFAAVLSIWWDAAVAQTFTLTLQPNSLPPATGGQAYSQQITAVGGNGNYIFTVQAGSSLPPGISFSSGGLLSGTAPAGSYTFTLQADDNGGASGFRPYTFSIGSAGGITLSPGSPLPSGTMNVPYSQTITASGGTGSGNVFSISAGSLPAGLSLNPNTGQISGTPAAGGTSNFTVSVIDNGGNTGSQAYALTIIVVLTVNPPTLPNGVTGTPYSQTVTAAGGTGGYSFAISAGALPTGLSLAPGGAITGTPTASGTYNFTVQVTDSSSNTGTRAYTVVISQAPLIINPPSLPAGTQGTPYAQTIVASGGNGNYSYAVIGGGLPPGLTLNGSTGALSGTPTAGGLYNFTVQASDTSPNTGTRAYAINIGTNSLTVNPPTLPPAVKGVPYSQVVTATGGTAPYIYSISAGVLPPGLSFNTSTGLISGTPTTTGTFSFTVQALDINGNTGSRAYTLTNRPDPATDAEVQGLVFSQVAAAKRFGTAQIENVALHLESLHEHFDACSLNFGVALPPGDMQPSYGGNPFSASPGLAARAYEPMPGSPAGPVARRSPGSQDCAQHSDWSVWVTGAVQFGSVTPDGTTTSNRFTTSGLTAGIDWRVGDNLIAGMAVGYGFDRTTIGFNGTHSDATSVSGTLYATYKVFGPWFVDTLLGYGTLGYDNSRFVADDSLMVSGTRSGSYWFGAIGTGYDFKFDALRLTPYLRAEFISVQLEQYSESGQSAELLTFGAMGFNTVAGTLGLRGSYDIAVGSGTLTPTARLEYQRAYDGAFQQFMYYTDIGPGVTSLLSQGSVVNSLFNAAAGLRMRSAGGISGELEYGTSATAGALLSQTLRASFKMPF